MKNLMSVGLGLILTLIAVQLKAEEPILTPDGYLGHPAFELGFSSSPAGETFTSNYSYTNYTIQGSSTGKYDFNQDYIYFDIAYPVDKIFSLYCGANYLVNATGSGTVQSTANNFTGMENSATNYSYVNTLSWHVALKFYTK